MNNFKRILEDNPIVAAVKDEKELDLALQSDIQVIFILFGDILNIKNLSEKIFKHRKLEFYMLI